MAHKDNQEAGVKQDSVRPAKQSAGDQVYVPEGYCGKELKPFEGRHGANDFLKLPSLISGIRYAHRSRSVE